MSDIIDADSCLYNSFVNRNYSDFILSLQKYVKKYFNGQINKILVSLYTSTDDAVADIIVNFMETKYPLLNDDKHTFETKNNFFKYVLSSIRTIISELGQADHYYKLIVRLSKEIKNVINSSNYITIKDNDIVEIVDRPLNIMPPQKKLSNFLGLSNEHLENLILIIMEYDTIFFNKLISLASDYLVSNGYVEIPRVETLVEHGDSEDDDTVAHVQAYVDGLHKTAGIREDINKAALECCEIFSGIQKKIFLMYYIEEIQLKEIASILGETSPNISYHLKKIEKIISVIYKKYEFDGDEIILKEFIEAMRIVLINEQ